jgi:hypothetical protein
VYEPSKLSAEPAEETMSLFVPLICRYGVATPCRWSTSIKIFNRVKNASEYTQHINQCNLNRYSDLASIITLHIMLYKIKDEMSIALGM